MSTARQNLYAVPPADAVAAGWPVHLTLDRHVPDLWSLGVAAVSYRTGERLESLRGADVVVVGSNFADERSLLLEAFREARKVARSVSMVVPPSGTTTVGEHITRVGRGRCIETLVPVPDPEGVTQRFPPLDWDDLYALPAEADWMVPGVVERGRLHSLYAGAKTGKSLLVQDVGMALAAGRDLLGQPNSHGRPVRVLYLDFENSRADVRLRATAMGYRPEELEGLIYLSFPSLSPLDTPRGGQELTALAEHHRADLVVIDTLSRVVDGDENSADTYRALYRHTLMALKAAGVTVLRLDHSGNDPSKARGSSAKSDDVDTVLRLEKISEDRLRLVCTHQRTGHHPEEIHLRREGDPLTHRRIDPGAELPSEVGVLVDHLDRLGVPATAGRDRCRKALMAAGIKVGTKNLEAAVKARKTAENLPGAGQSADDQALINNTCPTTSGPEDLPPGETCPGQVEGR